MMVSDLLPIAQATVEAARGEAGLEAAAPTSATAPSFRFFHRNFGL
jgi:hypothetical protein